MVVTILGGVGTLYGPIVGSIVYTGMKDVLSKVIGNWELIVGFVLVFIMLAGEKGIWGSLGAVAQEAVPARDRRRGRAGGERPMIDTQLLISGVIFGLSIGSIFFLMTIGLSLCFGLMRIISLDQLLYYSVGAYITLFGQRGAAATSGSACIAGVIAAGLLRLGGRARGVPAHLRKRPHLQHDHVVRRADRRRRRHQVDLGPGATPGAGADRRPDRPCIGTDIPVYRLLVIAAVPRRSISRIWLFLNRTIIGKAIRAGIEDVEHVEGLGINVSRLFTMTFIIAGALSGLAGGLHAPLIMVFPDMGLEVLAFAFMVVIIGGLGSVKGTFISAFLVGQVVSIGSLIYAPLAQMAPFAIMLLILLVKPTGLYGSKMIKR